MLTVANVSYSRMADKLFQPLHFTLEPGQIGHVIGPNGIGKTTLLKIVAGLFPPTEGHITWNGKPITKMVDQYALGRHFLTHELALKQDLTVAENLRYNFFCSLDDPIIRSASAELGLQAYFSYPVQALSAGFAHKLSLLRLLADQRKLWILDEVFTALDQAAIVWFAAQVQQHCQYGGMVLITSHQKLIFPVDQEIHLQASSQI